MVQGIVTYPGIDEVKDCRYTRTLGVLPSVAVLEMVPQPNTIAPEGTLRFEFGSQFVELPDCHVDYASIRFSSENQVVSVRIFDRRWKWKYGGVFGQYNIRRADGTLDTDTEKSPQELAEILLTQMGETNWNVSALPDFDRPQVHWDGDNPAVELSRLARGRGCEVALTVDGNFVRIVRLGVGQPLPTNEITTLDFGFDAPEKPQAIDAYGARTLYQSKLRLKALWMDTAGNLNRLDPHSSTIIADMAALFGGITSPKQLSGITDPDAREAAEKTLFRWYVVDAVEGIQWSFVDAAGNTFQLENIWQALPINDFLVDTFVDADGIKRRRRAYVEGVFLAQNDPEDPNDDSNTPLGTVVPYDFSLDANQGIVKFERPVYRTNADNLGSFAPARLWLVTSYHFRHPDRRFQVRSERLRNLGGSFTPAEILLREDVQLWLKATYSADTGAGALTVTGFTDNFADVFQELDLHLDAAGLKYQQVRMATAIYRGIQPFEIDGARRQITWSVSDKRGAFTSVSLNNEFEVGVLHAPERARIERDRSSQLSQSRRPIEDQRRADDGVM